jgi:hypothetical protein
VPKKSGKVKISCQILCNDTLRAIGKIIFKNAKSFDKNGVFR